MKLVKHLPNALTCGNLLCGCLGLVRAFEGDLVTASWLIGLAAVLDFFDGFAARLLHVQSPIGKELDSLADMTTFGVLPAVMVFELLRQCSLSNPLWAYLAFILAISSALRLAKFNIDTRQSDSFLGVPTPANGLLIASLPLILFYQPQFTSWIINFWVLVMYSLLMAYLMVSEWPLFALKFKSFGWKGNEIRFSFLGIAVVLLLLLNFAAIPIIVGLYILLSLMGSAFQKEKANS